MQKKYNEKHVINKKIDSKKIIKNIMKLIIYFYY